jgi:hypothetical protein
VPLDGGIAVKKRARLGFVLLLIFAGVLLAKPKMRVRLYGQRAEFVNGVSFIYVYLILPNGDHALGMCGQAPTQPSCTLESFAPEKRRESTRQVGNPPVKITCYESETYEAERKKNDITLYGGVGKVTYHIYGSW